MTTPTPKLHVDAAINEILHAVMPDGSPIRPEAKIDAMLHAAGIDSLPSALRSILGRGIKNRRLRSGRQAHGRANV